MEVEGDVDAVKWVPLSARKGEEDDTVSGEKEAGPWAVFGCGLNSAPGPFYFFLFLFPFSFLVFI
jgi:hypothetical protein